MKKLRILLNSILMIALCVSLVASATFALFTDESNTNIAVTSGKVEIVATAGIAGAWSAKWDDGKGDYVRNYLEPSNYGGYIFTNKGTAVYSGNTLTINNMSPGDGLKLDIDIRNYSSVKSQYRIEVKQKEPDAGLLDVLSVSYMMGEEDQTVEFFGRNPRYTGWTNLPAAVDTENGDLIDTLHVEIELPFSAGDKYQGLSSNLVITVYAVQGNASVDDPEQLPEPVRKSTQIGEYAADSNWNERSRYTEIVLDSVVTVATNKLVDEGFNGTYNPKQSWDLYASESATLTISVPNGYELLSFAVTYNGAKGALKVDKDAAAKVSRAVESSDDYTDVTSGSTYFVSDTHKQLVEIEVLSDVQITDIEVMYRDVTNCKHVWDEEGKVYPEPTCSSEGVLTYTCSICGSTKIVMIEKLPHTPEIVERQAATCTETGLSDGSKCSVCHETIKEQEIIPATGHRWGIDYTKGENEDGWVWSEDYTSATLYFTCGNTGCEATHSIEAKVTSVTTDPNCTQAGKTVYTATISELAKVTDKDVFEVSAPQTSTKEVAGDRATGHNWYVVSWNWAETEDAVEETTVTIKCDGCKGEHTLTVDETELVDSKDADCGNDGVHKYSASVSYTDDNGATVNFTTDEENYGEYILSATGEHSYKVTFDWDHDSWTGEGTPSVTVTVTCENCDTVDEELDNAAVSMVEGSTVAPDCVTDGSVQYTASVEYNGTPYTNKETFKLTKLSETGKHNFGDKWFEDNNGKHYQQCSVCGAETEHAEHNWGENDGWTANGDIDHSRTCLDCGKVETDNHHYVEGECDTCGHEHEDHDFGDEEEWTTNNNSTITRKCSCGYEETMLPKLNQIKIDNANFAFLDTDNVIRRGAIFDAPYNAAYIEVKFDTKEQGEFSAYLFSINNKLYMYKTADMQEFVPLAMNEGTNNAWLGISSVLSWIMSAKYDGLTSCANFSEWQFSTKIYASEGSNLVDGLLSDPITFNGQYNNHVYKYTAIEDGRHSKICVMHSDASASGCENSTSGCDYTWVENGNMHVGTCSKCGNTKEHAASYDMDSWKNHGHPCRDCSLLTDVHDANWDNYTITSDGKHQGVCTECGATGNVHNITYGEDNWTSDGEGTHTHSRMCTACNHKVTEDCEYTWDNADGNHNGECNVCHNRIEGNHEFNILIKDDGGQHHWKCICGEAKDPEECVFEEWTPVAGTHTHTGTCVCGNTKAEDHSFAEDEDECSICRTGRTNLDIFHRPDNGDAFNWELEEGDHIMYAWEIFNDPAKKLWGDTIKLYIYDATGIDDIQSYDFLNDPSRLFAIHDVKYGYVYWKDIQKTIDGEWSKLAPSDRKWEYNFVFAMRVSPTEEAKALGYTDSLLNYAVADRKKPDSARTAKLFTYDKSNYTVPNGNQFRFPNDGNIEFLNGSGDRGSIFSNGVTYIELKWEKDGESHIAYMFAEQVEGSSSLHLFMYNESEFVHEPGTGRDFGGISGAWTTRDQFNSWVRDNYKAEGLGNFDCREWNFSTWAHSDGSYYSFEADDYSTSTSWCTTFDHTYSAVHNDGKETHTNYCVYCGAEGETEPCEEYINNGMCSLCGHVYEAREIEIIKTEYYDSMFVKLFMSAEDLAFIKDHADKVVVNSEYTGAHNAGKGFLVDGDLNIQVQLVASGKAEGAKYYLEWLDAEGNVIATCSFGEEDPCADGHDWKVAEGEIKWDWHNGYTDVTATFYCSRCDKISEKPAEITHSDENATCNDEWNRIYTATVTGPDDGTYTDTAEETRDPISHTPGNWTHEGDEAGKHHQVCSKCGDTIQDGECTNWSGWSYTEAGHSHTCGLCQYVETVDHDWADKWTSDNKGNHYHECQTEECNEHSKSVACDLEWGSNDEEHWQYCETCDYSTVPVEHSIENLEWADSDKDGHWLECADDCGGKVWYEEHDYSGGWLSDTESHYQQCKECDYINQDTRHEPQMEWADNEDGTHLGLCEVDYCGYGIESENHHFTDGKCDECKADEPVEYAIVILSNVDAKGTVTPYEMDKIEGEFEIGTTISFTITGKGNWGVISVTINETKITPDGYGVYSFELTDHTEIVVEYAEYVAQLTFGKDVGSQSEYNGSYDSYWNATRGDYTWDIVNFYNNSYNNNWTYIKAGKANSNFNAYIITQQMMVDVVENIVLKINSGSRIKDVSEINLIVASSVTVATETTDESSKYTVTYDQVEKIHLEYNGELWVMFEIPNPAAGYYYIIEIVGSNATTTDNGSIWVDGVDYFGHRDETEYAITKNIDGNGTLVDEDGNELASTYQNGTTVKFKVSHDDNHQVEYVMIDDVTVDPDDDGYYTFTVIGKSVKIDVKIVEIPQTTESYYKKITSTDELEDGQYLIVYEGGNAAFNGALTKLDDSNNYVSVEIDDGKIAYNADIAKAEFEIKAITDGYTIKSASGYYVGQTSDANGLASHTTTTYTNTINFAGSDVTIVSSGGAYLRYNATSGQNRFRYYKSGTYTDQKAIQLYKLVGGSTGGGTTNPETPEDKTYTASAQIDGNKGGTVTINERGLTVSDIKEGAEVVVTITPDPGYHIASVKITVDDEEKDITEDAKGGTYKFNIAGNTTITVAFEQDSTSGGDDEEEWVLVKNANELSDGSEIIIVGKGTTYAMSTDQKSNNRGTTSITIEDGIASWGTEQPVQKIKVVKDSSGMYALYVEGDSTGYLTTATGGNYLRTATGNNATINKNTLWTITIDTDGTASIVATNSDYNTKYMRYNPNNGQSTGPLIACYTSASQTALQIYKNNLSGSTGGGTTDTEVPGTHECTRQCDECGGCQNATCSEDVCADKCLDTCPGNPNYNPGTSGGGTKTDHSVTLKFGPTYNSKGTNGYGESWSATKDEITWNLSYFHNNNNGWDFVRAGNKSTAYKATITNASAWDWTVTEIVMKINSVTTNAINGITLQISKESSFTTLVTTISVPVANGDCIFSIPEDFQGTDYYYRIVIDCKASANGTIEVSEVVYSGYTVQ